MTYDDVPIGAFLDDIASERVAPAGGSAVAITGAMGAALCEMVCIHTLAARPSDRTQGSDEGAQHADLETPGADPDDRGADLEDLGADLARQRRSLLALAAQDGAVVEELFGGGRDGTDDRLAKRATGIPLAIAEAALVVLEDAAILIEQGRSAVAADARTGAYLADAAIDASIATVRINLESHADRAFTAKIEDRIDGLERSAASARNEIFAAGT